MEVAVADHEHGQELDCAGRLARFFPSVVPLRIPVQVTAIRAGRSTIREAAVVARVPCITTLAVARAAVDAIAKARAESTLSLQERHEARAS